MKEEITLKEAQKEFKSHGLDPKGFAEVPPQEEAFQGCLEFLQGIRKTSTFNNRSSYGLKHLVERNIDPHVYFTYVYEGTCILAALASGFKARTVVEDSDLLEDRGLNCWFNIYDEDLKRRNREWGEELYRRQQK